MRGFKTDGPDIPSKLRDMQSKVEVYRRALDSSRSVLIARGCSDRTVDDLFRAMRIHAEARYRAIAEMEAKERMDEGADA
jgi:hypothetical protein